MNAPQLAVVGIFYFSYLMKYRLPFRKFLDSIPVVLREAAETDDLRLRSEKIKQLKEKLDKAQLAIQLAEERIKRELNYRPFTEEDYCKREGLSQLPLDQLKKYTREMAALVPPELRIHQFRNVLMRFSVILYSAKEDINFPKRLQEIKVKSECEIEELEKESIGGFLDKDFPLDRYNWAVQIMDEEFESLLK